MKGGVFIFTKINSLLQTCTVLPNLMEFSLADVTFRFTIKANRKRRKDDRLGHVIINEKKDKVISAYQVRRISKMNLLFFYFLSSYHFIFSCC